MNSFKCGTFAEEENSHDRKAVISTSDDISKRYIASKPSSGANTAVKHCSRGVRIQEITESLQQVERKGGSCPPIRALGMGDVTGDCGIFAKCNPFQGYGSDW